MGTFDDIVKGREPDPEVAKKAKEKDEEFIRMFWSNSLLGTKRNGETVVIKSYTKEASDSTMKKHQPKKKKSNKNKKVEINTDDLEEEDLFS